MVIITAEGGLGKTRLLYEALYRAGNRGLFPQRTEPGPGEDWGIRNRVIAGDPLDMMETRLHTFDVLKEALRDAFQWHPGAEFPNFDAARTAYRRRRKDHVDFGAIKAAADEADRTFLEDYRRVAEKYRLVWALDTAEQLTYWGTSWLKDLLTPEDLDFSTRDQLLRLLPEGKFPNTTILLAGRPESEAYFKELEAVQNGSFTVTRISLELFTVGEVKQYIQQLAGDYRSIAGSTAYNANIADTLEELASNDQRLEVLHRYTAGQPVRLALFTDVLAEGKEIPDALLDTPEEAEKRIREKSLEAIQTDIEAEFLRLIFEHPADLRAQILTALARARRGLDVERLCFVLGSKPDESPENWKPDPDLKTLIETELDENNPRSLRYLSFVKRGYQGRLILQDEMYRIFDKYMAQPERKTAEARAREILYRKLHAYARTKMRQYKEILNRYRKKDEDSLAWRTPAEALSRTFRYLGEDEEERRASINDALFEAEMERLHYKLRLKPDEGLNDWYLDLAEQRGRPGDLPMDIQGQIELLRFIHYDEGKEFWREFIPWSKERWAKLENAAQADEANRWVKRFWLRKQYSRGIEFADKLEEKIASLPLDIQKVLSHPFFREERAAWKAFCLALLGQDTQEAIKQTQKTIANIENLIESDFIKEENDFGLQPAVARNRLNRIISAAYNAQGYLLVTRGRYSEAVQAYQPALYYLRDTKFVTMEGVARNNLSRALSELGLITRAVRICRDALDLREKLGYENPIAYSHNTLALIYNNGMQPENAWVEAAKAVAYFRKLEDTRGLGLALHHLAEALRRLALSPLDKLDTPEQLFDTAREAISEAVQLFEQSPETMRRIEVYIEQGCLYRDMMRYYRLLKPWEDRTFRDTERAQRYYRDACNLLEKALKLATDNDFPRHRLDAQVNLVWTHYFYGTPEDPAITAPEADAIFKQAEDAFHKSEKIALELMDGDESCLLRRDEDPPQPGKTEPYHYLLLGKAWTAVGRVWMDRFLIRQAYFRKEIPDKNERIQAIHQDKEAQDYLYQAAEAFVLALAYNKLYSIRSPAIPVIFNMLYDYLKGFNRTELADFFGHQEEVKKLYRVEEIQITDLSDMTLFLTQSFGDYLQPLPGQKEARR